MCIVRRHVSLSHHFVSSLFEKGKPAIEHIQKESLLGVLCMRGHKSFKCFFLAQSYNVYLYVCSEVVF